MAKKKKTTGNQEGEYRDGAFIVTVTKEPRAENPAEVEARFKKFFSSLTLEGRNQGDIDKLRKMAGKVDIDVPELDEAQEIFNSGIHNKELMAIFYQLLHKAETAIQNEATKRDEANWVPDAVHGGKFKESTRGEGPLKVLLRGIQQKIGKDAKFDLVMKELNILCDNDDSDVHAVTDDGVLWLWWRGKEKDFKKKRIRDTWSEIKNEK